MLFWCLQRFESVRSEIAVESIVEMTVIRLGRGWDGDVAWAGRWRLKMELWRRVKCCTSVVAVLYQRFCFGTVNRVRAAVCISDFPPRFQTLRASLCRRLVHTQPNPLQACIHAWSSFASRALNLCRCAIKPSVMIIFIPFSVTIHWRNEFPDCRSQRSSPRRSSQFRTKEQRILSHSLCALWEKEFKMFVTWTMPPAYLRKPV